MGTIGAVLASFGWVPQVIKMWRRRSADDISLAALVQFTVGVSCWILYGLYLGDAVVIGANIVTLSTVLIALTMFFRFRGPVAAGAAPETPPPEGKGGRRR